MKPRKSITIKDIAAKSGFSTATISRVLNKQGGYSAETEKKILETVKEWNYSTGISSTPTIGILVPDLTNEWFANVVCQIEQKLYHIGYHCCICSTDENPQREQFCFEGFTALKVSAVISFLGSEELVTQSTQVSYPVIFIDRIPSKDEIGLCLESDNYLGGYMATELLIRKGCRRILFIGWNQPASVSRFRQKGYSDALHEYGLYSGDELILDIISPDHQYEKTRDLVYYTIKKKIEFDGIFASNDLRAAGALEALIQSGISVPRQVKIIGFDDTPTCLRCYPALSTVRQDPVTMAQNAVDLLLQQLNAPQRLCKHLVLPVSIVERGTT